MKTLRAASGSFRTRVWVYLRQAEAPAHAAKAFTRSKQLSESVGNKSLAEIDQTPALQNSQDRFS
jgi:hypothetical protein